MYIREIIQKVKSVLEERRSTAERIGAERELEIRARSSEFAKIDDELRKTGPLIFKTAVSGGDITPIRERNELLLRRRAEILRGLGYPADYTDAPYTCKKCSDTGYSDGYVCSCYKELMITENIKGSGIGRLIEKQSFENFDLDWYGTDTPERERMESNLAEAIAFAKRFDGSSGENLLLVGNTGTGKTHISTAIAKAVIERGYSVLYDSTQNIISEFENDRFRSGYGAYEPKADKYLTADLLILDDLGAEFSNQFTVSCLYNLLNTRQNKGLSTIISTNLHPTELSSKYEDRIFSRLVGSDTKMLLFVGRDHRIG